MQEPRQIATQLNKRLAWGKKNLKAACMKGELEFKIFFSTKRNLQ